MNGISALFLPKSVAVIGASKSPQKIGYRILNNLIRWKFEGKIYPVNPKYNEILGLKCYPSILEIPDDVDLAVVTIPAEATPHIIEELGKKGVKAAVMIPSGFSEIGRRDLEQKIVDIAKKYGVRILGPNVFGIMYIPEKLNATFAAETLDPHPGNIALITQSGALGVALIGWTKMENLGLSAMVSIGNKADIDDADLISFLGNDPNTEVILIYMEDIRDPRRFLKIARRVTLKKPIIVIKAGRTKRGIRAAASHTGALAAPYYLYEALFKQAGILYSNSITEAFYWARMLSAPYHYYGDNTLIITNGGGAGVIATDTIEEKGLKLMELPDDLKRKFKEILPPYVQVGNPIDLAAYADRDSYYEALTLAIRDKRVHAIIVINVHTVHAIPHEVADGIIEAVEEENIYGKPIIYCGIGGEKAVEVIRYVNERGIPAYWGPEAAVSALYAFITYHNNKRKIIEKGIVI